MLSYYKIYHYSRIENIKNIDPQFFGTGICSAALRRGALGINKSYFFIHTSGKLPDPKDRPIKYEVYLPCEWKIYDADRDPEQFQQKAQKQLNKIYQALYNTEAPFHQVVELTETLIKEQGYQGRTHADGIALALFYPLSTSKPQGNAFIYDYSSKQLIERILTNTHTALNQNRFDWNTRKICNNPHVNHPHLKERPEYQTQLSRS